MIRPRSPEGRRFLAAVASLRQPYRSERSVKLVPGGLLADRFLVSLPKTALGAEPLDRLRDLAGGLGLPACLALALAGPLEAADTVHLGHEASPEGGVHKLYLEFSRAAREASERLTSDRDRGLCTEARAVIPGDGEAVGKGIQGRSALALDPLPLRSAPAGDDKPGSCDRLQGDEWGERTPSPPGSEDGPGTLVHLAFKWDPARPGRHSTAEYRLMPGRTGAALRSGLAALCQDGAALRAGGAALEAALSRAAAPDLMLLAVSEPENGRLSYDLNLYEASLRVGSLAASLAEAATAFGIATAAADHFAAIAGDRLGHVAGGLARDGRPFLTVYHGGMPA